MPAPILVGGTQRSGTHALGHLLDHHPDCVMVPRELAFHASPAGLAGLRRGEVGLERFLIDMRGTWWWRRPAFNPELTRGLHKTFARDELEAVLRPFARTYPTDPDAAVRDLLDGLLAPLAGQGRRWVEMSPTNVTAADVLLEALPDARLVHVVRDGRDVACSLAALPWGPPDVPSALERWARTLEEAEEVTRPFGDRVHVVHLEELALLHRDREYARLLEALGLPDTAESRTFFDAEISPERAHLGRWKREVPEAERPALEAAYRDALARLAARGVTCAPPEPWDVGPFDAGPDPAAARIDPWADGVAARI